LSAMTPSSSSSGSPLDETITGFHDKIWNFESLRRRGDGFHDGGVGEHAGFGGVAHQSPT
jgi:hypothetical protein